ASSLANLANNNAISASSLANLANNNAYSASQIAITASQNAIYASAMAVSASAQAILANSNAATAQATANGKSKVFYATSAPSSGVSASNDLWFDTSNDNRLNKYDGSTWQNYGMGNLAISSIDAGKITAGTISAALAIGSGGKIYIGTGLYNNANTQFYASADGRFSLGTGLTWDGSKLTASGTIIATSGSFTGGIYGASISGGYIGTTPATTVVSNAATGATALQPGSAASDVNSNSTTIVGGKISTGQIQSTGYSYTSGNFSTTGTQINLDNGAITSKNFAISSTGTASFTGGIYGASISGGLLNINGNASVTGYISATSGSFNGSLYASAGLIGGWSLAASSLYATNILLDTASGIVLGSGSQVKLTPGGAASLTNLYASGTIIATTGSFTNVIMKSASIASDVIIGATPASTVESNAAEGATALQAGNGVTKNVSDQITRISTTGLTISTATTDTGGRVSIDSTGFYAYASDGTTKTIAISGSDGSASFKGNIVANSGSFTGTINSTASIFGAALYGGLFQTSGTSSYIKIDGGNNAISFFNGNTTYGHITPYTTGSGISLTYGGSPDPAETYFPAIRVQKVYSAMYGANATNKITVGTGITIDAGSNDININSTGTSDGTVYIGSNTSSAQTFYIRGGTTYINRAASYATALVIQNSGTNLITMGGINDATYNLSTAGRIISNTGVNLVLDTVDDTGIIRLGSGTASTNNNSIVSPAIYWSIGTGGANAVSVANSTSNYIMYRNVSRQKYKTEISPISLYSNLSNSISKEKIIAPIIDPNKVLDITPVFFKSILPIDENKKFLGFIAEDIYDKFPELSILDADGNPDYYNVNGIVATMLAVLQNQKIKIDELETRIAALENK
ncbi:MAG: hypothetical protein EB127_00840, partial [Alphaproteobacteria bacterium]|nr:hypothetical protein [Alphaproteobacteria bacterium]